MVAYAFMRELPYTVMVLAGGTVAVAFIMRYPSSSLEPLAAVIVPAVVSALGRSKPAEDVAKLGGMALLVAKWKGWNA